MITICFTQCNGLLEESDNVKNISRLPIIPRCLAYEALLRTTPKAITTYDEHLILIAQWLHRNKEIEVILVSLCNCDHEEVNHAIMIVLDNDGDMPYKPHHGCFSQRLTYLR